jgi:hypothetical protein
MVICSDNFDKNFGFDRRSQISYFYQPIEEVGIKFDDICSNVFIGELYKST